jgi:hypothetical protein
MATSLSMGSIEIFTSKEIEVFGLSCINCACSGDCLQNLEVDRIDFAK